MISEIFFLGPSFYTKYNRNVIFTMWYFKNYFDTGLSNMNCYVGKQRSKMVSFCHDTGAKSKLDFRTLYYEKF